ncbi:MAG: acyl-CoA dehydrogenase [Bacteroidetes bacterium GWA2_31_9]|nr:MAG: acyl-CoA dehydrogenase [Bacteroidetes bacterium GWA2_31_9]
MEMKLRYGGDFLTQETKASDIFIPEEFDEEQKMIEQTCYDFLNTEVYPIMDKIDTNEKGLMRGLISKAGELGLLGIAIPAEYDGFEQSYLTVMRANEAIGGTGSFSVAYMAHTGIGTLPLLYYGNEEQKRKYLTKLATGEWAAAYCLTEPGAGSDANSGKTRAVLSEDGKHYILNGQKMWITNGGFAELQTVFAKIDNDRVLSAFLVEKDYEGVIINPEEKKMGIKGSSTVQIFYNDVKVPVENLLGKRGEGFRIALNILHVGRIKLGATTVGACRRSTNIAVNYSNERKQFGSLISTLGAIKHKLAEMVIKTFTNESAVYRASYDVHNVIQTYKANGKTYGEANIEANARFAVECALLKVYGSEVLDYIVDECVQVFGGMGFSAEAAADRPYRDSRINRIFEGTNEINRLLVVDTAMKNAMKGEIDLLDKANELLKNVAKVKAEIPNGDYYSSKMAYVKNYKKAVLLLTGYIYEKFKKTLSTEHELFMNISDMMINLYVAESTILRVEKMESLKLVDSIDLYKDMIDVFVFDAGESIRKAGLDAIYSSVAESDLETFGSAIKRLTETAPVNVKDARRRIADKLIEDNRYNF